MLTGASVAQLLPLLASPLLTRLYDPADFATLAVFMAVAGPLGILATARFEFAIMLPEDEDVARDLASVSLALSVLVATLVAIVTLLAGERLAVALGLPGLAPALPFTAVAVLAAGTYQTFNYWSNRRGHYRRLALAAVLWQLATALVSIAVAIATPLRGNGLLAGFLAGQAIGAAALAIPSVRRDGFRAVLALPRWRSAARQYRQFPLFNMPYSLVGNFAAGFVTIALTMAHQATPAGLLSLARRVMYAPVTLVTASLGQVFFQEAARSFRTPRLEALTLRLLTLVADLATPVTIFAVVWAPDLFALVFGERWRAAGHYARAFSPVAFCFLFTSWPERLYEVAQRQHVALALQVVSDAVSLGILMLCLRQGVSPLRAVAAYALVYSVYHSVYLFIIFRIAGFALAGLSQLAARIAWRGAAAGLGLGALRLAGLPRVVEFGAGAMLLAGALGWEWRRRRMALRNGSLAQ